MDSYIGNRPVSQTAGFRSEFIATAGQTQFNVSYAVGYVDVFLNGVKLGKDDFTANDRATVNLAQGAAAGDLVAFIAWAKGTMVPTEDFYNKTEIDALIDGISVLTPMTKVNASGTAVDFTGIPPGVKRITVMLSGVSPTGASASDLLLQLGDSGGIETSGYDSGSGYIQTASAASAKASTAGFVVHSSSTASVAFNGIFTLALLDAATNTWVSSHNFAAPAAAWQRTTHGGGVKSLSGELDRLRLTFANGTETFDAGIINVMYE
jgi:hypothetical protein